MKKEMKEAIKPWLEMLAETESIPENIVALDLGMFETDGGYAMYICGGTEYDEEDPDWACDPEYMPEDKYLMLTGEGYEDMDWEEFLNGAEESIKEILAEDKGPITDYIGDRIVTTGFDDGDLIRIK